jgi:hypothetical protein
MLRIDRNNHRLLPLKRKTLSELGLLERHDIQRMIRESADHFFSEMGEPLKLIGEEIRPSEVVNDRIDLLAVDKDGDAVVIELKRTNNKLHLLQALAYAGMIARWEPRQFVEERQKMLHQPDLEQITEELEGFLEESDPEVINRQQRIILLAEEFDWEVLVAAEWLYEKFEVDIRCYRLTAAVDGDGELLTCVCIFPPPELARHAIRRRSVTESRPTKWASWDAALENLENAGVRDFYKNQLAQGRSNYLRRRALRFHLDGRYLFSLFARRKAVYVWQRARFTNDVQFWTDLLGADTKAQPVREGRALRFYLRTGEDCARFAEAIDRKLTSTEFAETVSEEEEPEAEEAHAYDGPP